MNGLSALSDQERRIALNIDQRIIECPGHNQADLPTQVI
jgi:hypothetical protein